MTRDKLENAITTVLRSVGGPPLRVTKIDVARRQLLTAIELWFLDGDPISVHTLAYAAHEIIHRLCRKQGANLLFDSTILKAEYRNEFNKLLKEDANFFKHAEREAKPDATRAFHPGRNILFIAVCILGLQRMGVALNDPEHAFLFWLYLHQMLPEDNAKESIPIDSLDKLRAMNKSTLFQGYLQARRDQRAKGLIQ